uniref:Uncharacterized protein n=1 Tax=Physcomitrium patens TaxID=3218 RepID=A0A2K1KGJ4_PHYPA|nr:hypothetical protein PHYPA_009285 [Physcomitrium patens]
MPLLRFTSRNKIDDALLRDMDNDTATVGDKVGRCF